ncbi:unnamed protein product [Nezara viridula]|uniref:CRAL-TRIO domain-containing protein n=1 Tax=Nezara viridula TaxID=85310 RepID=A0A9P0MKP5_NEZVI|nr:unnamed protein product [Nezara viridula]
MFKKLFSSRNEIEMKFPWKVTAEQEYAKDPKLKPEDVQKLQEWMKSLEYLPQVDDEMLCHFLHACFYDVEHAKKTIETFYNYRTTMPDFFANWDPSAEDMQETLNNIMLAAPLPQLTQDGYRVIVCKLNDTNPERFVYPLCVKWMFMCCMHTMWDKGIINGYVIVYDATGYTMSHLLKCSLTNVRNYINYGKNASPIRVVKIVFINTSTVIKRLMTLARPFLSKEIVNMMEFHTSAEPFFGGLPPETVPEDYNGSAPPILSLHRESVKAVTASREWLIQEEKVRIDEAKKNGKSKKDTTTLEDSFTKLEFD